MTDLLPVVLPSAAVPRALFGAATVAVAWW